MTSQTAGIDIIYSGLSSNEVLAAIATSAIALAVTLFTIIDILPFIAKSARRRKNHLGSLFRFADFFGLATRKAIKAMAGDYSVEIMRLRKERRPWAVRWNVLLAWGYAVFFIIKAPAEILLKYFTKSIGK